MNAPFDRSDLPLPSPSPLGKYRLRVEDYLLLDQKGAFDGEQTELVEGDVIVMSPEWRPHMRIKDNLAYSLRQELHRLGSDLFVGTGGSVALSDTDQPRPDIILTREIDGEGAVPKASIALLVEVSSTTLANDLGIKASLYARHGVPEYWIADVDARIIHQLWAPIGDHYSQRREAAFGDHATAATIAGLTLKTSGL